MKKIILSIIIILTIGLGLSLGVTNQIQTPTVKITAQDNIISNKTDGFIKISVKNPLDTILNVDISVNASQEIYFFSDLFIDSGISSGNFIVPPGKTRSIDLIVRAEKKGIYPVYLNGEYYTESDIIKPQKITSTFNFTVRDPSSKPRK